MKTLPSQFESYLEVTENDSDLFVLVLIGGDFVVVGR